MDNLDRFLQPIYQARYDACSRARGLVNKLPADQRAKHYSRITARQNKLRALL